MLRLVTILLFYLRKMIVDGNITSYIHSLEQEPDAKLEELRRYAAENDVPIIRREMESFLKVILEMKRPARILEIGTAIGYSAIFMANAAPRCAITTIENYPPRIAEAKANIGAWGLEGRIKLIEDDAVKVLAGLEGPYDMIFLDAAKGQYITLLSDILRLLPEGGILIADNVLQDGEIIESRFVTPRRQRTIHERMREFIWEVKHTDELETSLVTIGDGITLSVRK